MMKTCGLFFLFFLFQFSANAQNKFGLNSGIAFSDQSGSNSSATDLITIPISVFGMIPLSRVVVMQPSIGYYPKGNKYRDVTFVDQLGANGYGDVNYRFDDIEVAIPFQYTVTSSKERKLLLGLGPYFSYAIGGLVKWHNVSGQNRPPSKSKINFDGTGYQRFDAGINLLMTLQVKNHWTVSASFDRGLVGNNQNRLIQQPKQYSHSEAIIVGYLFK
jgi:hypothetical protein